MLTSAASSMSVFENAMAVTQNNVANASTPGYAKQVATFEALPFNQGNGDLGGVQAGPTQSTRDEYAEQSVRDASTQLGNYQQQVTSLTSLQSYFDITGKSGVPAALSSLYSAFSTWSANPSDTSAQQNVITQAQDVASSFNTTASNLSQTTTDTNNQLSTLVDQVNTLVGQLSGYNAQIEAGDNNDPGLDASVNSTLQSLSQLTNITTTTQPDGAVNVMLGTGTMLLAGSNQNKLSVSYSVPTTPAPTNSLGPPDAQLIDSHGSDVTANATGGELGGVLYVRNQVLPSIQGDGSQDGSLNQMAKGFADQVNSLIGFPLFTYNSADGTNTAASLQVSATASIANLPSARVTALTGTNLTSPIAITAGSNDGLNLQVDGTTWPTITLNPTDTTASTVASDLNSQFSSLGIDALASVNGNGGLVLSTTNTGSTGSIAVLSGTANATLGLTSTTPSYSNASNTVALALANLANSSSSGQVTELTGTSVSPALTITAGTNDALKLEVDGQPWPTITLNPADTTATAVAADLNTQFAAQGIGAQASVTSNGSLALSTTNTGSNGSIAILNGSANTTLGLTNTTPTYQNGINGLSFTSFFGNIASGVGTALSNAQAGQTAQQSALTQTEAVRQQISGVDLNTEAANLLQLQNSYEAASKMVSVINNLTTTVLNLIGNAVS
jgi:flagellar hook-associated protein 1 FlgK